MDNQVIDPIAFRHSIAYVMQDNTLLSTATPRESIAFSARLRLPSSYTSEMINTKVNDVLIHLGLTECADRRIGNILNKGISGGEMKRTSVGVEIITEPNVSWESCCCLSLS